jgi:Zn-dependent peptidase ImmA (M78 family)
VGAINALDINEMQPKAAARQVLVRLYNLLSEEKNQKLTADQFFPIKFKDIIQYVLDWRLDVMPFDQSNDAIGVSDFAARTIQVRDDAASSPQRAFTIAHEIGHIVLHNSTHRYGDVAFRIASKSRPRFVHRDSAEIRRERDADIFATELLMPEKAVRNHFERIFTRRRLWSGSTTAARLLTEARRRRLPTAPSLTEVATTVASCEPDGNASLAAYFGVSRAAMSNRLIELGLVY